MKGEGMDGNPKKHHTLRNPENGQYVRAKDAGIKTGGIKGIEVSSDICKRELDKILEIYTKEIATDNAPIPLDVSFDKTVLISDVNHGGYLDIYHHSDSRVEDALVKIAVIGFLMFAIVYTHLKIVEMIL